MLLVNLFVDSIAPSGHVRVELCVPLPSQLRVRVLLNSASTTDWNQPTCVSDVVLCHGWTDGRHQSAEQEPNYGHLPCRRLHPQA
jgi:hypothetical protein